MTATAQLWLGDAPALWRHVHRCYYAARDLVDGDGSETGLPHYSRQTPGAQDFMGSGWTFVLYHESDAGRAVWGVILNRAPGTEEWRWRCSVFRNESSIQSSDMIKAATAETYSYWERKYHGRPGVPLTTEVDPARVRRKRDPGRCFIKAGWRRVGVTKDKGLIVFEAPP